jgi:hypothetical protein
VQCGIPVWLVKLTEESARQRDRRYPDGSLFRISLVEPQLIEPKPGRVSIRMIPELRLAEFAEDGPLREHHCPAQTRTCKNCRAPLRSVWVREHRDARAGRAVFLDDEPSEAGNFVIDDEGHGLYDPGREHDGTRYARHDCPGRSQTACPQPFQCQAGPN